MLLFKAILIGLLQGLTEFMPISSGGHIMLAADLMHMEAPSPIGLAAFAHLGSVIAIFFMFQQDLLYLLREALKLPVRLWDNVLGRFSSIKNGMPSTRSKLFTGNWGKLLCLVIVSCIPTAIMGVVLSETTARLCTNRLAVGIGFLITALFLVVTMLAPAGNRIPRELKLWQMLVVGCCQGLAVFPGISRLALCYGTMLLFGLSKKAALRASFLMAIPVYIGAFLYACTGVFADGFSIIWLLIYLLITFLSAFVGMLVIRRFTGLLKEAQLYGFVLYTVILAVICIFRYFSGAA